MAERIPIPLDVPSLITRADGALAFAFEGSAFVDLSAWPPPITVRAEDVVSAARSPSGRWLVYAESVDGRRLRWYDSIDAPSPSHEEPEPISARDLTPFVAELADASREIELAHTHALESVHLCGEHALVVPRHVGLGEYRHPWIRRDGRWIEETSLPAFEKSVAHLDDSCTVACVRLADGTDLLIWNGQVYAYDGATFTPRFEERLALQWYRDYAPAVIGSSIFACHDNELVELGDAGLIRHLAGVRVSSVARGPDETLVVEADTPLLYAPREDSVATIARDVIGKHGTIVGVSHDAGLVVYDRRAYALHRIPASELATLPRRAASEATVTELVGPTPLLDELGAASRPRIAACGDDIVIADRRSVRLHHVDAALAAITRRSDVVAVARSATRAAAVHTSGVLLELGAAPEDRRTRTLRDRPRSLAATVDGRWIVPARHAVWVIDFDADTELKIAMPGAIAAAGDADNTVLLLAEDGRVASWSNGELVDVPPPAEQLVACAAIGRGRFVCVGQTHLFVLDLETRELELLRSPDGTYISVGGPHLAVSPDHRRVAWSESAREVVIADLRGDRLERLDSVTYTEEFSEPEDETLTLHGLAFLDGDRLAIALDRGRGNIIDLRAKNAFKIDPQRGDPRSSWVFVYGGNILIAG